MEQDGKRISKRSVAEATKVSPSFANKIINELKNGSLKDPKNNKYRKTGAGSRSLEERDDEVIKAVRRHNPQATLQEYVEELRYSNGTQVSGQRVPCFKRLTLIFLIFNK